MIVFLALLLLVSCQKTEDFNSRTGAIVNGKVTPKIIGFLRRFYDDHREVLEISDPPPTVESSPKEVCDWSQKHIYKLTPEEQQKVETLPEDLAAFMKTTQQEATEEEIVIVPGCRLRSMFLLSQRIRKAKRVIFLGSKERELLPPDFDSDNEFIKEVALSCSKPKTESEAAALVHKEFMRQNKDIPAIFIENESKTFVGSVETLIEFFQGSVPDNVVFYHIAPYSKDKELVTSFMLDGKGAKNLRFYDAMVNETPYTYYRYLAALIYTSCKIAGINEE